MIPGQKLSRDSAVDLYLRLLPVFDDKAAPLSLHGGCLHSAIRLAGSVMSRWRRMMVLTAQAPHPAPVHGIIGVVIVDVEKCFVVVLARQMPMFIPPEVGVDEKRIFVVIVIVVVIVVVESGVGIGHFQ